MSEQRPEACGRTWVVHGFRGHEFVVGCMFLRGHAGEHCHFSGDLMFIQRVVEDGLSQPYLPFEEEVVQ